MVGVGAYVLSVALLALLVASLALAAVGLRRRLLPGWRGAPAVLVDAVAAVGLLVVLAELLGSAGLLYGWLLVLASCALAAAVLFWARGRPPEGAPEGGAAAGPPPEAQPPPPWATVLALGAVAVVFAGWGLTAADALGRGVFNFDSLWYHLPFSVEIAQSHSVTGLHHTETVFTNWFYPQNSELLHAVAILLGERDTLSLFLNFGWLALAFLAAWCVGRPYRLGPHAVVAAAVVLGCHTLAVREPGAAKNDVVAAALLLAAVAILVSAAARRPGGAGGGVAIERWALAAAGLAAGLAVGTKLTVLALAAALSLAVIVLAPRGRRWAAAGWWFVPAALGGGYWYLRNVIAAGNPLPQVEQLGPLSLPHPEQLQSGRPDFSIAHYATDTGIWREYFFPGLEDAFGALWPLVLAGAVLAGAAALLQRRDRLLRWLGAVVLIGLLAYAFTPLGAAGLEGAPEAFRINVRFVIPALLLGVVLAPVALARLCGGVVPGEEGSGERARGPRPSAYWASLAALLAVFVLTDRADAVLRDPDRLAGWALAALLVLVPAALLWLRGRGASRVAVASGCAVLLLAVAAIGYPVQRSYLESRFANADRARAIPGMDLDAAYRWARGVEGARIGLAGTTAGFLGHGFYGTDLSNRVLYLGEEGPHGAFNAIPTCRQFRAAVNRARLDYLVTAPFLNFIRPGEPVPSPETAWLRNQVSRGPAHPAGPLEAVLREGPVTVWRVRGPLDPGTCPPPDTPRIPQQPTA